jgi:hypothetical protein
MYKLLGVIICCRDICFRRHGRRHGLLEMLLLLFLTATVSAFSLLPLLAVAV